MVNVGVPGAVPDDSTRKSRVSLTGVPSESLTVAFRVALPAVSAASELAGIVTLQLPSAPTVAVKVSPFSVTVTCCPSGILVVVPLSNWSLAFSLLLRMSSPAKASMVTVA